MGQCDGDIEEGCVLVAKQILILINTIKNILIYLQKSGHFGVLSFKIFERFTEIGGDESKNATAWAVNNIRPLSEWLKVLDPILWEETLEATTQIRISGDESLSPLRKVGIDLGGGGALELLYFVTRLIRPTTVLETGVAAGWSSFAFLKAIDKNTKGTLLSSDLPYFRIKDPEKYVGFVVPEFLRKSNWILLINGDRKNFKSLLNKEIKIELAHYDSDKRKMARRQFFKKVSGKLAPDSILIMDDIQNNCAFKEYVDKKKLTYCVIESEGKYVGVILNGKYANQEFTKL